MPFSAGNLLNDAKITLEKSATDAFGSAVETFAKGTLGGMIPSNLPGSTRPANRNDGSWYSSSYAAALAGGTNYRPKLKFLFKVEFIFTEQAMKDFPETFRDNNRNDFTFMIKSVDRPKFDFEYEDDVNMYNFRTKVLKKIRHRDLSMVFYDDTGNRVFNFFRTLMMLHSPITDRQRSRDNTMDPPQKSNQVLTQANGMAFSSPSSNFLSDTAHRGSIDSAYGNSIECIRVKQIFVDPSADLQAATKMVTFDFINPRVVSFDLDELSHEANEANQLTMTFDYDWMEMVNVGTLGFAGKQYNVEYDIQAPGVNGAPSDITPNRVGSTTGAIGNPMGGNNALGNALSGILGRGASQLTSDAIGKLVKTVGGNGRFATAIGGAASSALAGPINGITQGAARELFSGATGVFNGVVTSAGNAVRSSVRAVTDSATAGPDRPIANVASSNAYSGTVLTAENSLMIDGVPVAQVVF